MANLPPLPDSRTSKSGLWVWFVVSLTAIIVPALGLWLTNSKTVPGPDPNPASVGTAPVSVPAQSAPAQPPRCEHHLRITSPENGQHIKGREGVTIKGTACELAGQSGWLFDSDPEDGGYYLVDGAPIASNGSWARSDSPLGDSSDVSKGYTIVLVLANQACVQKLAGVKPNADGDIVLTALPADCLIGDQVDVVVTW